MKVTVIGCGRWGTFLGEYATSLGHEVCLYGRKGSESYNKLYINRANEYLKLDKNVKMTNDLEYAVRISDIILISINSQQLRSFSKHIAGLDSKNKIYVLCMKGIENSTGKRLTEVFTEETGLKDNVAVWVGPGHVQDFVRSIPNCMVVSSYCADVTKEIVHNMSSDLIRFYYGKDIIGVEIGAAAKNVMGIAAGILDGLGYSCLKGALMARGAREISRLVKAMGGEEITVYGLSHLGDYEATLFSEFSHNRRFGEDFIKGRKFKNLAEGIETAKALKLLSERYRVDLPISWSVNEIIENKADAYEALINLFLRPIKYEF